MRSPDTGQLSLMHNGIQYLWSVSLLPECSIGLNWVQSSSLLYVWLNIWDLLRRPKSTRMTQIFHVLNLSPHKSHCRMRRGEWHRYISSLEFSLGFAWAAWGASLHTLSLMSTIFLLQIHLSFLLPLSFHYQLRHYYFSSFFDCTILGTYRNLWKDKTSIFIWAK